MMRLYMTSIFVLLFIVAVQANLDPNDFCTNLRVADFYAVYHQDDTCDRFAQNHYSKGIERNERFQRLMNRPEITQSIPEDVDVYCPLGEDVDYTTVIKEGMDTTWIVHNTASTAVVVIYKDKNGNEKSAVNQERPPESDVNSIIQPNEFQAFQVYHGQLYYVRELVLDASGTYTPGRVLLQHRSGYRYIHNSFGNNIMCPRDLKSETKPKNKPKKKWPKRTVSNDQPQPKVEKKKEPPNSNEQCNVLKQGFKNGVGCPINVFHVECIATGEGKFSFKESFKFRLGINESARNFHSGWDSPTSFFHTYTGHTFIARLVHDPSTIVDAFTLEPSMVRDCPYALAKNGVAEKDSVKGQPLKKVEDVSTKDSSNDSNVKETNADVNLHPMLDQEEVEQTIPIIGGESATAEPKAAMKAMSNLTMPMDVHRIVNLQSGATTNQVPMQ